MSSYKLIKEGAKFNPEGYWKKPVKNVIDVYDYKYTDLFDQNGYDLTEIEKMFAVANSTEFDNHREHRFAIKKLWYSDVDGIGQKPRRGCMLNHCYLFERKGYTGEALEQLKFFAMQNPLFCKVIQIRPKWGLDFSMDYIGIDRDGNPQVFEVFHYEWDSFSYEEAEHMKKKVEMVVESRDWESDAFDLMDRRNEWQDLPFFEQSDWKCKYFGLPSERFKMVTW